jgi:hypothetical protein
VVVVVAGVAMMDQPTGKTSPVERRSAGIAGVVGGVFAFRGRCAVGCSQTAVGGRYLQLAEVY